MDRIADMLADEAEESTSNAAHPGTKPTSQRTAWAGQHPINLRVTLPLPFRRWYVTLVAGPERRSNERLMQEREKHPLDTLPNLMFLLSIGIVSTTALLLLTAVVLIQGFGWSIELIIPS